MNSRADKAWDEVLVDDLGISVKELLLPVNQRLLTEVRRRARLLGRTGAKQRRRAFACVCVCVAYEAPWCAGACECRSSLLATCRPLRRRPTVCCSGRAGVFVCDM